MTTKNNDYINIEVLEKIAEDNGILKAYILIKNIFSAKEIGQENSDLSIEQIEKNLIASWNLKNGEKISQNFSTLKELFENEDQDNFLNLFDKLLEEDEDDN